MTDTEQKMFAKEIVATVMKMNKQEGPSPAELTDVKNALEFYADTHNYFDDNLLTKTQMIRVLMDAGDRARRALAKLNQQEFVTNHNNI